MSKKRYDVSVVGAGPAGSTAANLLAHNQRRVALIDRHTFPRPVVCAGWLNARAAEMFDKLGVDPAPVLEHPLKDVTFVQADFSKQIKPRIEEAPGYLVDRAAFDNLLVDAATRAGIDAHLGKDVAAIDVFEDHVVVHREHAPPIESRLLILATGRDTSWLKRLGFDRHSAGHPAWCGIVERDCPGAATTAPRVTVVFGLDGADSFALCVDAGPRVSVTLNWYGEKPHARAVFVQVCRSLQEHDVVDVDLSEQAAAAPILFSPASFALEMESHVGKNMIIVGDAGGFISAASNEGIYPAMWSARIASDVVQEALDSTHSQDTLMTFESKWRHEMADYLRPLNTDMHFLLPLVFNNQLMADRMAAAFFSGENL